MTRERPWQMEKKKDAREKNLCLFKIKKKKCKWKKLRFFLKRHKKKRDNHFFPRNLIKCLG